MRMFFCALKRRGALDEQEVEAMRTTIVGSVVIREHLTHCEVVRPTPEVLVVEVSNEPRAARTIADALVSPCGMLWDEGVLDSVEPGPDFADRVSRLSGRFSALVLKGSAFAIGTPAHRVDSVFHAENDGFVFFGNQASVLSALRDGEVRYAPGNLVSFISAGYFGSDETPYEGVTALPPLTTVYHDGVRLHRFVLELAAVKEDGRSHEEIVDACAAALTDALQPLVESEEPILLGLTGGKDSRLLLAALAHAGVRPRCHTDAKGEANRADVWVARAVAERVGVEHAVIDRSRVDVARPSAASIDLMAQTATTLRNADGMISATTPVTGNAAVHGSHLSLWGHGGECLRGGWAEYHARPTAEQVAIRFRRTFEETPMFAAAALEHHRAFTSTWIANQLAARGPADVLDIAYLYFRVGRWVAAGSRGSATRVLPLLDNRVSREVLSMDASSKRAHVLHRELIARLLPDVRELPLANTFWHGTPEEERDRLRATFPLAFTEEKVGPRRPASPSVWQRLRRRLRRPEVAGLAPPLAAHVRDYLVREGRLDLLRGVVDPDRTVRFLRSPGGAQNPARVLLGLYSAAVLLAEPWLGARLPSRPIPLRRARRHRRGS